SHIQATRLRRTTRLASEPVPPKSQKATRRRRLLIGALGVLVLAAVIAFGVPSIRLALNTVSTDDAYVNGHVTFVAARVQVSRVPERQQAHPEYGGSH